MNIFIFKKFINFILILSLIYLIPSLVYSQELGENFFRKLFANTDILETDDVLDADISSNTVNDGNSRFCNNDNSTFQNYPIKTKIEEFYKKRSGNHIEQQGYDLFGCNFNSRFIQTGGAQDDYILGIGDELSIMLQGGVNQRINQKINREGNITVDYIQPIFAAGKTFGEVKDEIIKSMKITLLETEAFISLANLKQVNVTVTGEVNRPGNYGGSGFSNVTDFLNLAGGIKKTGSLRNIKVIQNKKVVTFDLYNILYSQENFKKLQIIDGATIVIPPLGKTVAITGSSKKPGIYELSNNFPSSISDFIKISGGFAYPGNHNLFIQTLMKDGTTDFLNNVSLNKNLKDGDLIFINPETKPSKNVITLKGEVNFSGKFPLKKFNSLSKLFKETNLLNSNSYKYAVIIKRFDKIKREFFFKTVNLLNAINGERDYFLKQRDEIFVLSYKDLEFIINKDIANILSSKPINIDQNSCTPFKELLKYVSSEGNDGRIKYHTFSNVLYDLAGQIDLETTPSSNKNEIINSSDNKEISTDCPKIFNDEPGLLSKVLNSSIILRGAIQKPGIHLAPENHNIKDLLLYSGYNGGKIINSTDGKVVDIKFDLITIEGSVRFPSQIKYEKGLNISSVFDNIDVFDKDAYLFFAVVEKVSKNFGNPYFKVFNPQSILRQTDNFLLEPEDKVIIFSNDKIDYYVNLIEKIENNKKKKITQQDSLVPENVGELKSLDDLNNSLSGMFEKNDSKTLNLDNNEKNSLGSLNLEKMASNLGVSSSPEIFNSIKNFELDLLNENIKTNNEVNLDIDNNGSDFDRLFQINRLCKQYFEFLPLSFKKKCKTLLINEGNLKFISKNDRILLELIKDYLVKVDGQVVNPSKFPIGSKTELNTILQFANGTKSEADFLNIEINNPISYNADADMVYPGSTIFVPSLFPSLNNIVLSGEVKQERSIAYRNNIALKDIIYKKGEFTENAYLNFGTIHRTDKERNQNYFIPFSPIKIFTSDNKVLLNPSDKIKIYSKEEINTLLMEFSSNNNFVASDLVITNEYDTLSKTNSLEEIIRRHIIEVNGEVSKPGLYILTNDYSLNEIINIASGFTSLADTKRIQITYPVLIENGEMKLKVITKNFLDYNTSINNIALGSRIIVPKIDNEFSLGTATIKGQVFQPGNYQILKQDTIFDLIKRSGGLQKEAYIEGLIFSRVEEKKREKKSVDRLRRELDKAIAVAVESQSNSSQVNPESIIALRQLALAASNFDPIGRLVGNYNSIDVLKNMTIVNGDEITIPRRPTSISVVGEIMTPGSLIWDSTKDVDDYIKLAAGLTDLADKKRIFTISPNGKATRKYGLWSSAQPIKPGTVIVIPRKIELSSTLGKIEAVTSVIYQLTLTLAGIDNLLSD